MINTDNYIISSLELHLFFARIMKEHALFLEAGFPCKDSSFIKQSDYYKNQFESLLQNVVRLSDGVISCDAIASNEFVTEFTLTTEMQTQNFTGISINQNITRAELSLTADGTALNFRNLSNQIRNINRTAIQLLNELILLKERILKSVLSCTLFTVNYPLLIKHIIREAKLYRSYVMELEHTKMLNRESMKKVETFWNQIMMEHALFIRGLLDPSEEELITTANDFAEDYKRLLATSNEMNNQVIEYASDNALEETLKFRDFKTAGTKGISDCKIQSIILPLLADHVLREANHYIRLLDRKDAKQMPFIN